MQGSVAPINKRSDKTSDGLFIGAIIDFVIIAFVLFLIIKSVNNFKKKEAVAPTVAPTPTKDQELLMEIRDVLKKQRGV